MSTRPRIPGARPLLFGRQRGVALVMALWLVVLLGVIAASSARNVHIETRLAFNQLEQARARALAESGVYRAILELFASDDGDRWPFDGNRLEFPADKGSLVLAIRNATGLVDLNSAAPALLRALLAAADVEEARRLSLADAILDWRDQDNLRHLDGAEDRDYRQAGLDWGARDGPFASIDELRYVLGMSGALFDRLAPYMTVYSGHRGIHPDFAPPALLAALAGEAGDAAGITPGGDIADTGVYHITARARSHGGAVAELAVVVRLTAAADPPYTILSWRQPPGRAARPRQTL